ncbi:DegT/DnrJ/EryC1/StrS family aminotransferase [Methanospirillum sp.]
MIESIPMSLPDINEDDIQGVVEVLRSGRLALGPKTEEFERLITEYVGVNYAVAVNSGTSALHLIVKSLGLGRGEEVLVPSFTFAASVNALLYEGITPVFVDVETDTGNIDPVDLERKITSRTKAIVVVDVFGHPVEWDEITRIARTYDLKVIDDSCEALGSQYKGKKIGKFGDAAAFAFYPNKQITTGEGGIIVTDNPEIAKICKSLRNQGRNAMGAWLEHERLGYNYRIDEMSSALGASQMKRIESFIAKREKVAHMYTSRLADIDWVRTPVVKPDVRMSWFVYVISVSTGINRDNIMQQLEKEGIPTRNYFSPVHLQKYIREMFGTHEGLLPVTEALAQRTISLPFHGNLTEDQVDRVVEALHKCVPM